MIKAKSRTSKRPRGPKTMERLIAAAAKEFEEHGFLGTDSNRIARRAGFAPQTFYRWFNDKTEIFLAVYQNWVRQEFKSIDKLRSEGAPDSKLVEAVVAHHKAFRVFRRSLRLLTVQDDRVRAARAASRLEQIDRLKLRYRPRRVGTAEAAVFLLEYERLCDAIADGEFSDLGIDESAVVKHLVGLYKYLKKG
jgi:AcrR family transcriptional regulator